ncbi:substrate-binding periplasmic protein [Nitrincola alkalilacustris]|uniref:substrate-binding periplasmic protein n=1 Tax=Nitrincola alkalilacustris TaxID=1571224 RepID=UPI00124D2653|nr:transporter substrate-binding domain-containing protein [Nitrincola alkalilacustris]
MLKPAVKSFLYILWMLLIPLPLVADHDEALRFHVPAADYPPYVIIEGDSITGLMVDPLRIAAERLGLELLLIPLPTKRADLMLQQHEIDVRFKSPDWVADPENYLWSDPILIADDILIYRRDAGLQIKRVEDLRGMVVLVGLGYHYPTLHELFDQEQARRVDFAFTRDILPALLREDTEEPRVAVLNAEVVRWLINEDPQLADKVELSDWVVHSSPLKYQFVLSARMQELVPKLNAELARVLAGQ